MAGAVAPAADCPAKVSHRKAPGAMSAIAFIVNPVKPNVGFISADASAIFIFSPREFCKDLAVRNVLTASTWMLLFK
jgi:hypothetical protein